MYICIYTQCVCVYIYIYMYIYICYLSIYIERENYKNVLFRALEASAMPAPPPPADAGT